MHPIAAQALTGLCSIKVYPCSTRCFDWVTRHQHLSVMLKECNVTEGVSDTPGCTHNHALPVYPGSLMPLKLVVHLPCGCERAGHWCISWVLAQCTNTLVHKGLCNPVARKGTNDSTEFLISVFVVVVIIVIMIVCFTS
jgi:hypothetical protein